MKTLFAWVQLLLCLIFCSACAPAARDATPKKILFFSKSSGFEHDAIKLRQENGRPGFAFAVLKELGAKHNFEFTFSKDGSLFSPEYLAQFDAIVFFTTGDLTQTGTDQQPAMTEAGKAAFLKAVTDGKGFVGVHSASDTFHSDANPANAPGKKVGGYVGLLGGEFISHDAQQPARQIIADKNFPGISALPNDFGPDEEWYSLKNFAPDLHVLLVQDTNGMKGPSYVRPSYPATWARLEGKGRVFYTSMGHREDIWTNPDFQNLLVNGINWATRRVDADITPNLTKVAPQAGTLPVVP